MTVSIEPIEEDLVIVGSGPAGLSAAIYAKQAGFNPLVVSAIDPSLIATTDQVNNFIGLGNLSGKALHEMMKAHYKEVCGADRSITFEVSSVIKKSDGTFELHSTLGDVLAAKAVIWAAGAKPRKLGIEGEDDLEALSYCATCDGSMYEGDPHLVVVGGGDSAVEEALYLAELVDKVTLLVRNDIRAKEELQERLRANSKIEVVLGAQVAAVTEIENMEVDVKVTGSDDIIASGVFVAIGHIPNSHPIGSIVVLDGSGFVDTVDETSGFFVAGDINGVNHRQAIIAAGDGAKAGIEASDYLRALV